MNKGRLYAVVIKFPDENYLEEYGEIHVRVLTTVRGLSQACAKMRELSDRFEKEVQITECSREYYIDILPLPETDGECEDAIKYSIGKASYSYPI